MSDSQAASSGSATTVNQAKPRNPVERAIVWGLIGAMIVVIGIEYRARSGYEGTISILREKLAKDGGTAVPMTEVQTLIGGSPTETEKRRNTTNKFVELKWFSLFKDYRIELMVEMDEENPALISYSTPNAVVETLDSVADTSPATTDFAPTMGSGGPMSPPGAGSGEPGSGGPGGQSGGPGGGGGGPRPPRGIFGLAMFEQISSELKVSPEQTEKLAAAAESLAPDFSAIRELATAEDRRAYFEENRRKAEQAVQEILDETQFARIKQLDLQQTGPTAIERPEIVEALGLSEDQAGQVAELAEAIRSLRRRGFGGRVPAGPCRSVHFAFCSSESTAIN